MEYQLPVQQIDHGEIHEQLDEVRNELDEMRSSTTAALQQLVHCQDVDHLIAELQTSILWTEIMSMFI